MAMVRALRDLFGPVVEDRDIVIERLGAKRVTVAADPWKLHQALANTAQEKPLPKSVFWLYYGIAVFGAARLPWRRHGHNEVIVKTPWAIAMRKVKA